MTPSPSETAEEVIYLASLTKCGDPNDAQHIWCHAELARLRERTGKAEARAERLEESIIYTAELYSEPLRYLVRGKLKPNLSIGFERRFQAMYDPAIEARRALEDSQYEDPAKGNE